MFGRVVPDFLQDDATVAQLEAVDEADAVEGGAVRPRALQRSETVHDHAVGGSDDVEALDVLADRTVACARVRHDLAHRADDAPPGNDDARVWRKMALRRSDVARLQRR